MIQNARPMCLDWQNRSTISDTRLLQLRSAFLAELNSAQIAPEQGSQSCELRVSIESTPTHFVFAAEISAAGAARVLISQVLRSEVASASSPGFALHLQKALLWQQSERILDALQIPGGDGQNNLLVLSREALFLFRGGPEWKLQQTWPVSNSATDRRAPRGELAPEPNRPEVVRIVFSGKTCELNLRDSAPPACQNRSGNWRSSVPFRSTCSPATWLLRADSGDWSVPDRIALFDSSLPGTQSPFAGVNTPGPVLSLAGGDSTLAGATTVVFNLSTGNYEVYAITLDCSN